MSLMAAINDKNPAYKDFEEVVANLDCDYFASIEQIFMHKSLAKFHLIESNHEYYFNQHIPCKFY